MPSLIAWLDASTDEQRRMREIVKLFSDTATRDELGIGPIRDALSDILFPGTSTLFTRARYMLFVPWVFEQAANTRVDADAILRRADRVERGLIDTLRREGATSGLIGLTAGAAIKTLPSTLYLVALRRYGILNAGIASLNDAAASLALHRQDAEEPGPWSPTLPAPPLGFPETTGSGFDLPHNEATWLRDRILSGAPSSALSHFIEHRPLSDTSFPWDEPSVADSSPEVAEQLKHARLFSFSMHGASLLYNLLLAEAHSEAGYESDAELTTVYRNRLAEWDGQHEVLRTELASWRQGEFWALIHSQNPRIRTSRAYVDRWLDGIATTTVPTADAEALRNIVSLREQNHKGAQSRLKNPRLLESWSGAAAANALSYRWQNVRTILRDIHNGLERTNA